MKLILFNLIILLLFGGCNNVRQNQDIRNNLNKIDYKRIYTERDIHKEYFLFMDFWSSMSRKDFFVIGDSLVKTNNLSKKVLEMDTTFCYTLQVEMSRSENTPIMDETIFTLIPFFEDDRLLSITLKCKTYFYGDYYILELFKTKYGKPKTIPTDRKLNKYVWILKNRVIEILPYNDIEYGREIPAFKITYYASDVYEKKMFQEKKRIDDLNTDANNEKAKALKNI